MDSLIGYLERGNVDHIWLDNFVAVLKEHDDGEICCFPLEDILCKVNDELFLAIYEGACRYVDFNGRFGMICEKYMTEAVPSGTLKSILVILNAKLSPKYTNTAMFYLILGTESFDVLVEQAAVKLASSLIQTELELIDDLVASMVNNRPEHPSTVDYRRLCFVLQLSLETGLYTESIAPFVPMLAPRTKYFYYRLPVSVSIEDLIDEIPLYDGKHECSHECYHD